MIMLENKERCIEAGGNVLRNLSQSIKTLFCFLRCRKMAYMLKNSKLKLKITSIIECVKSSWCLCSIFMQCTRIPKSQCAERIKDFK